jgi:L-alanine-DL-glutamate epimerase-like enolase superfamily enzyme
MARPTDVRIIGTELFFLPLQMRVPLKFGTETVTSVTCARARVRVEDAQGRRASGWGETPLSVQWVWPSREPYADRHERLKRFCVLLAEQLPQVDLCGHAFEVGAEFEESVLPVLLEQFNSEPGAVMPLLAALVCLSPFDLALHDSFGKLHHRPIYQTYNAAFLSRDLDSYLVPAADSAAAFDFTGRFPCDYLASQPPSRLPAWHLVGGLDPIVPSDLTGDEPADGYPVLLRDWIQRDGLKCLKIKLRGNDAEWDFQRLARVGAIAREEAVDLLSADFNCTVTDPQYVNAVLDRLKVDAREVFDRLLYVEQPFPYELEEFPLDVRSVSARKPLFLDESAHNWRLVRRGRELGWTGVALKTCKTQTGALLSACWARAHGMQLMVQDLTNPMLAQIPHLLLASHVGTIAGVETNGMQFYPEASRPEEAVHPGLYRRRHGCVDLSSIRGPGFGYRLEEIGRELPEPAARFGNG